MTREISTSYGTQPFYMVTIGNKTWYWSKETGEFDGTSSENEAEKPCI